MAQASSGPSAADPLPEADRLLTAEAVAEMVGVRVDYIWALCRQNEIPHLRFGRVKRFRRAAVLKWLEHREQGGVS
jgi:excisionase family DNA binding protein